MPAAVRNRSFSEDDAMPSFRKPPVSATVSMTGSVPKRLEFPASSTENDRLLNAREVASRLGVSERWVRDHTTVALPRSVPSSWAL